MELCSQTCPGRSPGAAAVRVAATDGPSFSAVRTTSAPRTASSAVSVTVAPFEARGAALARVRFQARTGSPALSMLRAIPDPMIPVPRTATVGLPVAEPVGAAVVMGIPFLGAPRTAAGARRDSSLPQRAVEYGAVYSPGES